MINVPKTTVKEKIHLTYFLLGIFLLVVVDIFLDILASKTLYNILSDVFLEGCILILVACTTHYIWKKYSFEKMAKETVEKDLDLALKQAEIMERKSTQFIKEFQDHIHHQFNLWNLSKSEKEIAFLLLTGKSSREISQHRFTSERTIRNQCASIYEKSECTGRGQFSAHFLKQLVENHQIHF